jgi:hypothetical protein
MSYLPGVLTSDAASFVSLGGGEAIRAPDFVADEAGRFAIDGRVTGLDPKRRSPTVEVFAVSSTASASADFPTATAVVDGDGRFRIDHLPAGLYRVRVLDFPPKAPGRAYQGAMRFTLPSGGALPPAPDEPTLGAETTATVSDRDEVVTLSLVPLGHLEGTVLLRDDASSVTRNWSRTTVIALPTEPGVLGNSLAPVGPIGDRGTFRTSGLPAGRYMLVLVEDPTLPSTGLYIDKVAGAGVVAPTTVQLDATSLTNLQVIASTATGAVSGVVRGVDGRPRSGAVVRIVSTDRQRWAQRGDMTSRLRAALTDADGAFDIRGLPPGDYFVASFADGSLQEWGDRAQLERVAARALTITDVAGGRANVTVVQSR